MAELDVRTAQEQARKMHAYVDSFNGQTFSPALDSVDRQNLAVALDNLLGTAAMLGNVSDRLATKGRETEPAVWANFPCYLIDHCEGETIGEEGLQRALAAMLADPLYATPPAVMPAAPSDAVTDGTSFLIQICGEDIDHPLTAIVPNWEGVRRFCVVHYTGSEDAENLCGNILDTLKTEFDEHEAEETGKPYIEQWEIGGLSIERVCDCTPRAALSQTMQPQAGEVAQCPNCKGTRAPSPLDPDWRGRCECAAPGAAIAARKQCVTCGASEPFTGSCGTSDSDTGALCKRASPKEAPATPQAGEVELRTSGDNPDLEYIDDIIFKLECFIDHATGGKLSKSSWALETLKAAHDEYVKAREDEAVAEVLEATQPTTVQQAEKGGA